MIEESVSAYIFGNGLILLKLLVWLFIPSWSCFALPDLRAYLDHGPWTMSLTQIKPHFQFLEAPQS